MYNKRKDNKMNKTILVVEVTKYETIPDSYSIEKTADNLEQASKYQVALKALNTETNKTYELFNALGQFEVDKIEKVVNDNK
jgi:hypothetical protein